MIQRNTVKNMVAYTCGVPPWTALAHGVRTARAAAIIRNAHRHTQCVAFVPTVGICRLKWSGTPCSWQLADNRSPAQSSSPHPGGIVMATARIRSRSRRCLRAAGAGAAMEFTATRATSRSSGDLLSTISSKRTAWTCSTTMTMRFWTTTTRTKRLVFVV